MNLLGDELYLSDLQKALSYYDFSDLKGKTFFIIGATGLICSSIIDLLLELDKKGLDLKIIGAGRNTDRINERFSNRITSYKYDAISPTDIPENVDYIIYGAGCASPELYISQPVETMLSNIVGLNEALKYCSIHSAKMVYISSSEVYGQKDTDDSFIESAYGYIDQDNIRNSYSESKRASEMLCRAYSREHNVAACMVRPGHIFGPTASDKDKRISSEFAYKAANGEELVMLSSGTQKRSYCYCIDCACAILTCLLHGEAGKAYNIGTAEPISIREMASYLAEAGGVALKASEPTEEEKKVFNPMNNSSLTDEKIRGIGFKQVFSVKVGLEHTVEIIKRCMAKS